MINAQFLNLVPQSYRVMGSGSENRNQLDPDPHEQAVVKTI